MSSISVASQRVKKRPGTPTRKLGTWKLAYADFLTALCAFFLIMWIVHGVSASEKEELAEQFRDSKQQAAHVAALPNALAASEIAATLEALPEFADYAASVRITAETGLVRIELTDHAERPLFEIGEGRVNATGQSLIRLAGLAIKHLPFPIMIEGHTDSAPSYTPLYSNWELSADRANSARRILVQSGVDPERIKAVSGLAATRPLQAENPHLPVNRRISIVLSIADEVVTREP